jgi:hypothetical protein
MFARRPLWLDGFAGGVLLGVLLALLTAWLARSGPSFDAAGAAWSLRGNGALVVPFLLGPLTLGIAWGLLLRRARHDGAGCGGLALAAGTTLLGLVGTYVAAVALVPPVS